MKILFLHGLESGPHGKKYQALKRAFGEIIAPDCTGVIDEEKRLNIIQATADAYNDKFIVVGSSMGGLMAMLFQQQKPESVAGMVLCAPALHRLPESTFSFDMLPPTIVIHGSKDNVVPLKTNRPFGSRLIVVNDDHSLRGSTSKIIHEVEKLKLKLATKQD